MTQDRSTPSVRPYRCALVRDINDPDLRYLGAAIETDDGVKLFLDRDYGIKTHFTEPYGEMGADMELVWIEGGDPEYFDRVIGSLSRTFLIELVGE